MNLYVYCVVLPEAGLADVTGIQAQQPRIIELDSLHIVVSDFNGSELAPSRENLFAHERVVEASMETTTPLPFRFGVVVREEKLAEFVRANITALKSDLERVRGSVEMGLKVMMDAPPVEKPSTGTDFLRAKQRQVDTQKETATWVDAAVVGLTVATDVSVMRGTDRLMVRMAHLVLRDHLSEYKSHIDALVRERTDCEFLRSGPWPPYSFISTSHVA